LTEISDDLTPSISSSSINVQRELTRAGVGISVLPNCIGSIDEQLVPVMPSIQIRRSFWTVVHRDLAKVARVRAVIEWLDQLVRDRTLMRENFS